MVLLFVYEQEPSVGSLEDYEVLDEGYQILVELEIKLFGKLVMKV